MKWLSLSLALAGSSQAALRFGCSTVSIQRLDPLVEPGKLPSSHVHQIVGGNAFNATMEGDIAEQADCTTCTFSENFSNYWTAVMFFKHSNGSYKRVPIMQNTALPNGINGGMTIYYTQQDFNSNGNQKITAFKPGFRMTVGSPTYSAEPGSKGNPGLRFVCLQNKGTRFPELPNFPTQKCPGGIMTVHHFPSCWDGKNLDSPDHQSHMYNTIRSDGFTNAPACPASHPVRMPQVAYETVWDTSKFNSLWESGAPNPFVWSFEGTAGGSHADYMFGWKGDSLQRAMDKSECFYDGCGSITKQAMSVANQCTIKETVKEQTDGWLMKLPGQ